MMFDLDGRLHYAKNAGEAFLKTGNMIWQIKTRSENVQTMEKLAHFL